MRKHRKALSIILTVVMVLSLQLAPVFGATTDPIVILHTNDVHSNVDGNLGYASVKGWKDHYEGQGSAVLVLDAGDSIHGLPVANLSEGESIIDIMNAVGYVAMTPGNHDFNYGTQRLIDLSKVMKFDLLSANFTDNQGNLVFPAAKIYKAGDKNIGIVGISTPETATKTNPLNVQGYKFNETEMAKLVQEQIDHLKADGADYVIALGHLGVDTESAPYRSTDLIGQVTGLDIFIDGHSHTTLENGEVVKDKAGKDVLLAQTGTQLAAIGKITINGDKLAASLIKEKKEDAAIKAIIDAEKAEIKPMLEKVVAKTGVKLDGNRDPGVRTQETNLGNLAADALRYAGGADIALTNGGGIRTSVEIGDITYEQLNAVFPFGNVVVTIDITGEDLLAALEHGTKSAPAANGGFPQVSGMSYEVHTYLDKDRVKNVMVNNQPLDLKKTYKLATNDFTQVGGDGYTMFGKYARTGIYGALDEALVTYIAKGLGGSVGNEYAKNQGRIKIMLTPYQDVTSHWAKEAIAKVVDKGLFSGVSATSFQPNAPMTRAMFVTVLGRASAVDVSEYKEASFADVKVDTWYGGYVEWASDKGIVSGVGNDKFDPNAAITREQMAAILTNYCTFIEEGPAEGFEPDMKYIDVSKISAWAVEGVGFVSAKAFVSGYPDGSFGPQKTATRAEVAVIMGLFLADQEKPAEGEVTK